MRLKDKVAIVTGGAVGIGKGISERLAEEGAKVVIAQRRKDKVQETVANILARGGQVLGLQTDVTKRSEVKEFVKTAIEWGGGLDILVNNAGVSGMAKFSSFMNMTEELWDRVMSVNLKAVFICSQEVAHHMIEQGSGKIIQISSVVGLSGEEFAAPYCASKAGVIGLTKVMALELARYRINVNCIAPGFIWTEATQPLIRLMDSSESPYNYLHKTPFGPGDPRDVGDAVVFLASDESKFFTGSTIVLDGGYLAY